MEDKEKQPASPPTKVEPPPPPRPKLNVSPSHNTIIETGQGNGDGKTVIRETRD